MEICAYYQYKVIKHTEYSYIDDENSLPTDWSYKTEYNTQTLNYDGGKLLCEIAEALNDDDCMDFTIKGNIIQIECFNPMYGTGDKKCWEIFPIDDERSD